MFFSSEMEIDLHFYVRMKFFLEIFMEIISILDLIFFLFVRMRSSLKIQKSFILGLNIFTFCENESLFFYLILVTTSKIDLKEILILFFKIKESFHKKK